MYQTVVTNMGDGGVPVTMQAVCSTANDTSSSGTTVIQVESQQVTNNSNNNTEHVQQKEPSKRLKRM